VTKPSSEMDMSSITVPIDSTFLWLIAAPAPGGGVQRLLFRPMASGRLIG
jgi:hypothetical protein